MFKNNNKGFPYYHENTKQTAIIVFIIKRLFKALKETFVLTKSIFATSLIKYVNMFNNSSTYMYNSVPNIHFVQHPLDLFCMGSFWNEFKKKFEQN